MTRDLGIRNAECGTGAADEAERPAALRVVPRPATRGPHRGGRAGRRAVTLVELLIAIAILAILASLILGVGAVAAETAREARTKQLIARLHTLLMDHYDEFRNRRVRLQPTNLTGQDLARQRLRGVREMLKIELPDRWSDVALVDLGASATEAPASANDAAGLDFLRERTGLAATYRRRYEALRAATNTVTSTTNTVADLRNNQGAECLYMIITLATGDGEAPGLFSERVIGDTDGDGAPEFLDGWGNPIQFLRWAPGHLSPAQLSHPRLIEVFNDDGADAVADAIVEDRDPFDLFYTDQFVADEVEEGVVVDASNAAARGFRLLPLIYSAGGDEELGIRVDSAFVNGASNPYPTDTDTGADGNNQLGAPLDFDEATDNLTNHLITAE